MQDERVKSPLPQRPSRSHSARCTARSGEAVSFLDKLSLSFLVCVFGRSPPRGGGRPQTPTWEGEPGTLQAQQPQLHSPQDWDQPHQCVTQLRSIIFQGCLDADNLSLHAEIR